MRVNLFPILAGAIVLTSCASSRPIERKVFPVNFETAPPGAQVEIMGKDGIIGQCAQTPCEIYLPIDKLLAVMISKTGYARYPSTETFSAKEAGGRITRNYQLSAKQTISGLRPTSMYIPPNCVEDPADADKRTHMPIPCVRIPPIMPPTAKKSGHCNLKFGVGVDGKTKNVEALSCSEDHFMRPAIKAVQKWVYHPGLKDGKKMAVKNVEVRLDFRLTNAKGENIPE